MQHHESTFNGVGGVSVFWQSWRAPEARAAVVIAHGAGEHGGRYGYVVDALVPLGIDVYALDHRGHGRSGGKRAVIDRMTHAVADLDTMVDLASAETGLPVYLLGHSLGGCISLAYALEHQQKLAGLLLSGPVVSLDAAPAALRVVSKVLSSLLPTLPLFGVGPEAISRDASEVARYVADPLVLHGKVPVRTLAEAAAAIDGFEGRVPGLTLPLLLQHGGADSLSSPEGSRMLHRLAGSTDKTLHVYEGYFHEIFNELPADRAVVLEDLSSWLNAHVQERASR